MKIKLTSFFGIAIAILCAPFFTSVASEPARAADDDSAVVLRVMCYNIRWGRGMDDVYDLERTANAIRAWNPDIVTIQEVDRGVERSGRVNQPKVLAEKLGMHYAFGKSIPHQGGEYGLLTLSRFPIVDYEMIHLRPHAPVALEQRGLLTVRIAIPKAGGPGTESMIIRVSNTHLCHRVQEHRAEQFAMINERLSQGDEPVILTGDFNARPSNELVERLVETWIDTGCPELGKHAIIGPGPLMRGYDRRIDYIFLRPQDPFELLEAGTIDDKITSDHEAIFIVVSILNPKP